MTDTPHEERRKAFMDTIDAEIKSIQNTDNEAKAYVKEVLQTIHHEETELESVNAAHVHMAEQIRRVLRDAHENGIKAMARSE